jgi:L-asparaginase
LPIQSGMRRVTLITTGGTIEKTYDEANGTLSNRGSIVRRMLRRLRLESTSVSVIELMSKDSLFLTDDDRERIYEVVKATTHRAGETDASKATHGGIVILHGTDTLEVTGQVLHERLKDLREPIVLTAAMRPFEMVRSDALQNLTEAIFATGVLAPGVYAVAHGRALAFPGVKKDRGLGTFVKA